MHPVTHKHCLGMVLRKSSACWLGLKIPPDLKLCVMCWTNIRSTKEFTGLKGFAADVLAPDTTAHLQTFCEVHDSLSLPAVSATQGGPTQYHASVWNVATDRLKSNNSVTFGRTGPCSTIFALLTCRKSRICSISSLRCSIFLLIVKLGSVELYSWRLLLREKAEIQIHFYSWFISLNVLNAKKTIVQFEITEIRSLFITLRLLQVMNKTEPTKLVNLLL